MFKYHFTFELSFQHPKHNPPYIFHLNMKEYATQVIIEGESRAGATTAPGSSACDLGSDTPYNKLSRALNKLSRTIPSRLLGLGS
jgi:hypothetical protein